MDDVTTTATDVVTTVSETVSKTSPMVLIGIGAGVALVAVAVGAYYGVRRFRNRMAAKKNTDTTIVTENVSESARASDNVSDLRGPRPASA